MIRKVGTKYAVCYDADGSEFAGPFDSVEDAQAHIDGLCAFDLMVLTGRPPGCKTDAVFMQGTENGRQFQNDPEAGDYYKKIADAHGVSITGKYYDASLCRDGFIGDPRAWISGRGDKQRIIEQEGWGSEGWVNVKKREQATKEAVPINPEIVERELKTELAKQGLLGKKIPAKEVTDLREKIADQMTPHWKKKGGTKKLIAALGQ